MMKFRVELIVVLAAAALATSWYARPKPTEPVDPNVTIRWTVEPGRSWYLSFELVLEGSADGANWTAAVDTLEDLGDLEGALDAQDWREFLEGFREAGGEQWHILNEADEDHMTDLPHYTLEVSRPDLTTSRRLYSSDLSEEHTRVVLFFRERAVDDWMDKFLAMSQLQAK